jgi:hypothetical protein
MVTNNTCRVLVVTGAWAADGTPASTLAASNSKTRR